MVGGIIQTYKPVGVFSHQVVEKMRTILKGKVGHTGTLDPFARGLLLICWGKATRFTSFFQDLPKSYRARMRFGISTDTYDVYGQIKKFASIPIDSDTLENAALSFQGTKDQVIPLFSATKYQGRRLYQYARKGESTPTLKKKVTIQQLEITHIRSGVYPEVEMVLTCSSGTYIRSIAHEIGECLGVGGYVYSLRREKIGHFSWIDSHVIPESPQHPEELKRLSIPIDQALYWLPSIDLKKEKGEKICQGNPIPYPESSLLEPNQRVKIYSHGYFLGIAYFLKDKQCLQPEIIVNEGIEYAQ